MKNAFVDSNGTLTSWGYAEANGSDTLVEVSDDFAEIPGQVQYIPSTNTWADYPAGRAAAMTASNSALRNSLLSQASQAMTPLQLAVTLGSATAQQKSDAQMWLTYVGALNSLDLTQADVQWPAIPQV